MEPTVDESPIELTLLDNKTKIKISPAQMRTFFASLGPVGKVFIGIAKIEEILQNIVLSFKE